MAVLLRGNRGAPLKLDIISAAGKKLHFPQCHQGERCCCKIFFFHLLQHEGQSARWAFLLSVSVETVGKSGSSLRASGGALAGNLNGERKKRQQSRARGGCSHILCFGEHVTQFPR